jgi:hypothetical protein
MFRLGPIAALLDENEGDAGNQNSGNGEYHPSRC